MLYLQRWSHSHLLPQLWRVSDLVYRPEDQILAELEPYRWVPPACRLAGRVAPLVCWLRGAARLLVGLRRLALL